MYSLTAVTRLTGLNASTLRTWERRYGVPQPMRSEANRRIYSADEVTRLGLIATLVGAGHGISELARLPVAGLRAMLAPVEEGRAARNPVLGRVLGLLDDRRFAELSPALAEALALLDPTVAIGEVFIPLMRQVGQDWATGRLPVYGEHLVSALVRQLLLASGGIHRRAANPRRMIFTTMAGDRHELGALFAWYLAVQAGAHATYLGPDLPLEDIAEAAEALEADVAVLSITSVQLDHRALAEELFTLQQRLAPKQLWVGARPGLLAQEEFVAPMVIVEDMADFWRRIKALGEVRVSEARR